MASILKVDTITGVTTAGSISVTGEGNSTTTNLQQGLCKMWARLDGTGTIALRDSFNVGSATDQGTGDYTINFTNSMNNDDYSVSANAGQSDKNFPRVCACGTAADSGFATSSHGILSQRPDNQADDDMEFVVSSVHGDLA